ncbi:D-alanyl-D-alanine carboxypeptidase/D-alanyl-D-alanine endopeptidase [Nocardioides sp. MAHUQ-72]|uniref:D-alanyl-D-alanine carboxypeptidase/D-alanyl-D-alanine endopeptidase n=1 Tax=unclassified Nocardioides TaxID=2615069 RepID=UPI00361C9809
MPVVLVLVLLASAAASWRYDLGSRWLGTEPPAPAGPAAVPPPEGLTLPEPAALSPVAAPIEDATRLDARTLRRTLAPALRDRDLGKHVLATVSGLDGAGPAFSQGSGVAVPASTMKLLTTTAALATLGPGHTFTTQVLPGPGDRVVLVGGGDPYLASRPVGDAAYPRRADVVTLARATARALRQQGTSRVRVTYDASLFSGPRVDPHWPDDYVPDGVVAPITSLWVDEGRPASGVGRVADPPAVAGEAFAAALRRAGITVRGPVQEGRAESEAAPLASVESAPLSEIVEQVLTVSDNEGAEVLAHHVGIATGGAGSFADGAAGVAKVLDSLGVPLAGAEIHDGSGLSREDRLDPDTLAAVLSLAASEEHPELRSVVTGLPVAGFTGSLESRFADAAPPGRGRVRAKTGTLTGVSALAGLATDLDGDPMVFVLMADEVAVEDTLDARAALDRLAADLGACHCAR